MGSKANSQKAPLHCPREITKAKLRQKRGKIELYGGKEGQSRVQNSPKAFSKLKTLTTKQKNSALRIKHVESNYFYHTLHKTCRFRTTFANELGWARAVHCAIGMAHIINKQMSFQSNKSHIFSSATTQLKNHEFMCSRALRVITPLRYY